ncbi:MAG: Eco57I restriction-modification methylase domain-containing protein, partial [Ottowia sp.]|nr:Eco57I restriction-modification methylase domain-containing protein [Ottowia sp.]
MKTYSASDFRLLFQNHFHLPAWQALLADLFGASAIHQNPVPVQLPAPEKEEGVKGFLLGELAASDGVRIGLFRYTVPAAQIERRRVGLNALVKPWLQYNFDAALVVFDAKDTGKWRFSLVADMRGEKTSLKRYTYVFGGSTSQYRTAVERFMQVQNSRAQADDKPVSFAALKDAFAVESLTKEFYGELFNWYLWALSPEAGVTFPNDISTDADDRSGLEERLIYLITRLMFVWFILQKKLVPDELFDQHRLTAWLKDFDPHSMASGNYYNAILQNLFFATLNNEITSRAFATDTRDAHGRAEDYGIKTLFRNPKGDTWFKRPDAEVLNLFRQVPFLNGGLFECLDKAAQRDKRGRIIYRDGFSREARRQRRAFIPNELFFGDEAPRTFTVSGEQTTHTVSGLLKVLGRYNFTIEENSPDDMEVALDPELLGKVFENLLGTFNPETRETARNASGSFYTPREIVAYMVQKALDAYMQPVAGKSDKEQLDHLLKIRVLDPACGSGAFPMGMLGAIVARAQQLGAAEGLHALKLRIIENCIFGVDIQTIAVQIAKLRFFISLVCEEQPNLTDAENNYGISPLPNLETKFVAANALIAKKTPERQMNLFEAQSIDDLKRKLDDIRHRHFKAKTRRDKLALRKEDEKTREELVAQLADGDLHAAADARQLVGWNPYDQNETAGFFDPEWMFGIEEGFDVVIGNPPYIQLQSDQGRLGNLYKSCGFKTFVKTGDIYCLFYERGWQLLKPNGHLCYITSNKWMRAGYGESTRKFLAENTDPQILIDFAGERIFESATVDTNILLFEKSPMNREKTACCIGTVDCRRNLSDFVRQAASPCAFTSSESWVILSPIEQSIKRKIEAVGTPLKDWGVSIYRGILTGCNEAFIVDEAKRTEILSWCQDASERERTEQLIRPILRGRDIKRY